MTRLKLIVNSFFHYLRANLLVATGVAISTAVLTGALIIGDSVTFSLEQSTFYRLGMTTHLISTTDRFFRSQLGSDLALQGGFDVAPTMVLEGMAMANGGEVRANKIQIIGIDRQFEKIATSQFYNDLHNDEVIISSNLADKLHLKEGDHFQVRIKKASLIPMNAPFVSDAETSVSFYATVKAVADRENMGFFNIKNSQTAPYNLFLSLSKLNDLMQLAGKANQLLIVASSTNKGQINDLLSRCFTTDDAGLHLKEITVSDSPSNNVKQNNIDYSLRNKSLNQNKLAQVLSDQIEITSDRIFIEDQVVKAFEPFPESHRIMTYFANQMVFNGRSTPYSFVSTIDDNNLNDNDIIINEWLESDLEIAVGDSVTLKYFTVGPLRQLIEKESRFRVKSIVPIQGQFGDRDLMPDLPGMSDAGHCRDWDAGVPIQLDAIRDKDEAYWNKYKGTPKAFISLNKAHQIWSNQYGNHTAIRINKDVFSDSTYRALFAASVKPAQLGVMVTAVRESGLQAARGGVDFSQLFLGLSFFLLVAAIFLTALLFLLNLENRQSQTGTLLMLGFTQNQIRKLLLTEGAIIALFGAVIGTVIAIIYTQLIFIALNTLWWEIVRTSVLIVKIKGITLVIGLLISVFIALITILIAVNNSFKRRAIELQQQQDQSQKRWVLQIKKWAMVVSLLMATGITAFQLIITKNQNPALFFLAGGLLLIGLLLYADDRLRRNRHTVSDQFSLAELKRRNRSRHLGRSLTILILFAMGTFLVVSTGANRQNVGSNANENKSGTGGFQYFAETSVPVLFDINDSTRRLEEGLTAPFMAVQFSTLNGDDASCLNLNRITNPAILGTDPASLKGRFKFATYPMLKEDQIWEALNEPLENGVVPAIADQTVIQWGLGLKVGDTLRYQNESGDTLKLKLIAGLSPSIFQGYVLISNKNFLKNFPTRSGSSVFLIETSDAKTTGEELSSVFRDNGWEMTTTKERLMEFNSVTNTYLSIFLALGILGLILGTVGLAVVLARSILERKNEIMLLQSLGFTAKRITQLLVGEYFLLLFWGVFIGFLSAIVAVLPNFISNGSEISFINLFFSVLIILINGLFWIYIVLKNDIK